jgi:hypothetical protein
MGQLVTTKKQENLTPDIMKMLLQCTELFAEAEIVPAHYRKKKSEIFIAVQTAHRMNLDPMMVMQGTYVIKGKLGMNSSFAISLANSSGLLKGGITYDVKDSGKDFKGSYTYKDKEGKNIAASRIVKDIEVTAYATLKSTEERISYKITMNAANEEGWLSNPKYKSLPELMLCYRAATFLIRIHIPQVLNGMHMTEELQDVQAAQDMPVDVTPKTQKLRSRLNDLLASEKSDTQIEDTLATNETITHEEEQEQQSELSQLILIHDVSSDITDSWCKKAGVDSIYDLKDKLTADQVIACVDYINRNCIKNV